MSGASREVGVVLRRSKVDHVWIDHVWSPEAILPDVPAAAPGTKLGMAGESELFYAGPARIELYPSETANYRDNLIDGRPQVWVALRRQSETGEMELVQITADPTEGETLLEAGSDIVASVPMPGDIAAWVAAFVDEFHVERVFHKRKRDKSGSDPRKNPGARMKGPAGSNP
jgi:hypothetical protein